MKDSNFNGKLIWPLPEFQPINNPTPIKHEFMSVYLISHHF